MATAQTKMAAARAFVRSLNILLKFVRMYGFEHARSASQFDTAWNELHEAIPAGDEAGMLLGVSGTQLLLDGVPIETAHAERSFAQMLSAAGIASVQFLPYISREELANFVRAFPVGGKTNANSLAEQLKIALTGAQGIRINEVRFVAEDPGNPTVRLAAQLTAKSLGPEADRLKNWLSDPQKLLQMIAAAEGSRGTGGPGAGGVGTGDFGASSGGSGAGGSNGNSPQTGTGSGAGSGGNGGGSGGPGGPGTAGGSPLGSEIILGNSWPSAGPASAGGSSPGGGSGGLANANDEIFVILRLLSHLGQTGGGAIEPGPFHQELGKLSGNSRQLLQQALSTIASQTPAIQSNDPMLVRLAEHLAIRFALDRYERGELRVNAVRQVLDGMSDEIATLRKILGGHEAVMAEAGLTVESFADQMDRRFWASVPASGKRTVLTSPEAWCIPPRNVRQYVEELRHKGDLATAAAVLENYAAAVKNPDPTARRRVAIGLADLADLYAGGDAVPLGSAIRRCGSQLTIERESELQGLISAAFVRLAQEAGSRGCYPALLQALNSLDGIENQRPSMAQSIHPRLGVEKRLPDFVSEAIGPQRREGLLQVLQRMPRATADCLVTRFNRASQRAETDRIVEVAKALGSEAVACLREHFQTGQPSDAAECTALLCRLDADAVARALTDRIHQWPRIPQDRALRMIAGSGASERGWLLLSVFDLLDPLLRPLAVDEIGMSGEVSAAEMLLRLAGGETSQGRGGAYLQLKAIEALGRLHVESSSDLLCSICESKKLWRWSHHLELRLAAYHAARAIAPEWADEFLPRSGFSEADLDSSPLYGSRGARRFRQRRYPRLRLNTPLASTAASERETIPLEVRGLSLSGGLANGEKHLAPGTLVALRLGSGLRPIRAQAFMRDARAQGLSFEFADMSLDERTRLREFLRENATVLAPPPEEKVESLADAPVS